MFRTAGSYPAIGAAVVITAIWLTAAPARCAEVMISCHSPGVLDGDTLRCEGVRVRLWGIQAPERSDPAGAASTAALAHMTTGREVVCRKPPSGQLRDRYGRVVAQCFADDHDVAAQMVWLGHARDWPQYSDGYYRGIEP